MASPKASFANLDALIPRADLFETPTTTTADTPVIRITDLEPGITYDMLRKPDFQRETANWTPHQIARLVQTFCDSDIIPAVILWQNGSQLFVVDGAHRLSALIAWIRNDYGAGSLSQSFFHGEIPERQRELHEQTAALIEASVGSWQTYKGSNPIINLKDVRIQWIKDYDAEQTAEAFIRINQGGTVIEPLEERILRAKRSALSVATRVVAHGGKGHEYWSHFERDRSKQQTPKIGSEIYKLLFEPTLKSPIKTPDVPLGGIGYGLGVLRLSFDYIAISNELAVPDSSRSNVDPKLPEDTKGSVTVKYLRETKRVSQLLLSNRPASLGLHPALYVYTAGGSFQAAALLNVAAWVLDMEKRQRLDTFRRVRGAFERLLVQHPAIAKPAAHKLGSGARTRKRMLDVLNRAVDLSAKNNSTAKAWKSLKQEFPHLAAEEKDEKEAARAGQPGAKFSVGMKSALSLADWSLVPKCPLCGGFLHVNGKVVDHATKRSDGGSSARSNARWVHPICNSNRDKDEMHVAKQG